MRVYQVPPQPRGPPSLAIRESEEDGNTSSPMHRRQTVLAALALADSGLCDTAIARRLGLPRTTVRDWLDGELPRCALPVAPVRPADSALYVYLLGLYLGDGCLTGYPRGVFKLRIFMDERYPGIVQECGDAVGAVRPGAIVGVRPTGKGRAVEVSSYWKHWPQLFPQHGPGRKHLRPIRLEPWQERLVDEDPDLLLRGLIHSDGCRAINTGRGGWRHPRYSFSNRSPDIRAIFCAACDRLDVAWTTAPHTVYVSRKEDVALLDEFVGAKG